MKRKRGKQHIMARKESEERVNKPSSQGGVEQINEVWQRAISK